MSNCANCSKPAATGKVVGRPVAGGGGAHPGDCGDGGMALTHDELNAALALHRKLDRLRGRLEDLEATGGVRAAGSAAPVQGGGSVTQAQVAAELSQEIGELARQLEIEQTIIRRALEKIPLDELERKLMVLRYVECWPWRVVGTLTGYAESHLYRLHQAAQKMIVDDSP